MAWGMPLGKSFNLHTAKDPCLQDEDRECKLHWTLALEKRGIWEKNNDFLKYCILIREKLYCTFNFCWFELQHFDLWTRPKTVEEWFCYKLSLTKVLWYFMEAVIWIFINSRRQNFSHQVCGIDAFSFSHLSQIQSVEKFLLQASCLEAYV